MQIFRFLVPLAFCALSAACGRGESPAESGATPAEQVTAEEVDQMSPPEAVELAPGLKMRILRQGRGETANAGDIAIVHYTGWLFDDNAPDKKGTKFDSSVDRGQAFQFPLGAGRVIKGWDMGVAGMKEGEKRELTIAPEMAYGERGAGGLIPPGSTLIFDVELARVQSTKPQVDLPKAPTQ